jgi:hypothetical protein
LQDSKHHGCRRGTRIPRRREDNILPELQAVDLVSWNDDELTRIEQRLSSVASYPATVK